MENGISIQIFDQIPALPKHQLKWRKCEITGVYEVSIMNLKIEVAVNKKYADYAVKEELIFTGLVKMPMTNWMPLNGDFTSIDELKKSALLVVAKQLSALAHHVASLANFEQV